MRLRGKSRHTGKKKNKKKKEIKKENRFIASNKGKREIVDHKSKILDEMR